jgi:hypothetical protein
MHICNDYTACAIVHVLHHAELSTRTDFKNEKHLGRVKREMQEPNSITIQL